MVLLSTLIYAINCEDSLVGVNTYQAKETNQMRNPDFNTTGKINFTTYWDWHHPPDVNQSYVFNSTSGYNSIGSLNMTPFNTSGQSVEAWSGIAESTTSTISKKIRPGDLIEYSGYVYYSGNWTGSSAGGRVGVDLKGLSGVIGTTVACNANYVKTSSWAISGTRGYAPRYTTHATPWIQGTLSMYKQGTNFTLFDFLDANVTHYNALDFAGGTDADKEYVTRDWTYINFTVDPVYLAPDLEYVIAEWDGHNITIDDRAHILELHGGVNDSSQYNRTLKFLNGAGNNSASSGKFGVGYNLSDTASTNAAINVTGLPASAIIKGDFCFQAWVNKKGLSEGFYGRYFSGNGSERLIFSDQTWGLRFSLGYGSVSCDGAVKSDYLDRWYNVVFSRNSSSITLYVDGVQENSCAIAETRHIGNIMFGNSIANDRWVNASMDEIHVYNRSCSATEIANNYQYERGRYFINITGISSGIYNYKGYANFTYSDSFYVTDTRQLYASTSLVMLDSDYDSGSVNNYSIDGYTVNVTVKRDSVCTGCNQEYQWVHFNLTNVLDKNVTVNINNVPSYIDFYAQGGHMVYSCGNDQWTRLGNHSYSSPRYTFYEVFPCNTVEIATYFPYSNDKLREFLESINVSPYTDYMNISIIGYGGTGYPIYAIEITNWDVPYSYKKNIAILTRQHPAETTGTRIMEGLIRFLISDEPNATLLRNVTTFYLIPNTNPDGVHLGMSRGDGAGVDENRAWDDTDQAEINIIRAYFVALNKTQYFSTFWDWHSNGGYTTTPTFSGGDSSFSFYGNQTNLKNNVTKWTWFDSFSEGSGSGTATAVSYGLNALNTFGSTFEEAYFLNTRTTQQYNETGVNFSKAILGWAYNGSQVFNGTEAPENQPPANFSIITPFWNSPNGGSYFYNAYPDGTRFANLSSISSDPENDTVYCYLYAGTVKYYETRNLSHVNCTGMVFNASYGQYWIRGKTTDDQDSHNSSSGQDAPTYYTSHGRWRIFLPKNQYLYPNATTGSMAIDNANFTTGITAWSQQPVGTYSYWDNTTGAQDRNGSLRVTCHNDSSHVYEVWGGSLNGDDGATTLNVRPGDHIVMSFWIKANGTGYGGRGGFDYYNGAGALIVDAQDTYFHNDSNFTQYNVSSIARNLTDKILPWMQAAGDSDEGCTDASGLNSDNTWFDDLTVYVEHYKAIDFANNSDKNSTTVNRNYIFINISIDETFLNPDRIYLEWNGVNETIAAGNYTITKYVTADGVYTMKLFANETQAGASKSFYETETRTINVLSNYTPSTPILNAPQQGAIITKNWSILNYSSIDANTGDNVSCFFYVGLSATTMTLNASRVNCSNYNLTNLQLSTTYYHAAMATDGGRNSSNSTVNYYFTYNLNASPSIPIINSPTNAQNFSHNWIMFNSTSVDPDTGDTVYCYYYTGTSANNLKLNASIVNCSSYNLTGIPDGFYYFLALATDKNSNSSNSSIESFGIDTIYPSASIIQASAITANNAELSFVSSEMSNYTLEYWIVDYDKTTISNNTFEWGLRSNAIGSLISETKYYYRFTLCDYVGNCNTTATYDFTTIPAYTLIEYGNMQPTNNSEACVNNPTLSWNATATAGTYTTYIYFGEGTDEGAIYQYATTIATSYQLPALTARTYSWWLRAYNNSMLSNKSDTYTFSLVNCLNTSYGAGIKRISFFPNSYTAKNVSPSGQTNTTSLFIVNKTNVFLGNMSWHVSAIKTGYQLKCYTGNNAGLAINMTTADYVFRTTSEVAGNKIWCWLDLYRPTQRYDFSIIFNVTP